MNRTQQRAIADFAKLIAMPPIVTRFSIWFAVLFGAWSGGLVALNIHDWIAKPSEWVHGTLIGLYLLLIFLQARTLLSARKWDLKLYRSGIDGLDRLHRSYEDGQDRELDRAAERIVMLEREMELAGLEVPDEE